MIFTGPLNVALVTVVWAKAGRDFCLRSEYRCRPVRTRVCSAAWPAASARGGERGQAGGRGDQRLAHRRRGGAAHRGEGDLIGVAALDDAVAAFNPTERTKGKTIIRVRP